VPTGVIVACVLETVFLVVFAATDGYDVARSGEALRVVVTYVTTGALFALVHLAVGARRRLALGVTFGALLLFIAVNVARQASMGSFDYGFVFDHAGDVTTPLGWHILVEQLGAPALAMLAVLPPASLLALIARPSRPPRHGRRLRICAVAALGAFLALVPLARIGTHEALTGFAASAIRFYAEERVAEAAVQAKPYPYVHDEAPTPRGLALAGATAGAPSPRPHVIVLFLESVNGLFVDRARERDGRHYMPVFDAHLATGLTVTHFYGSSVHSSRGHFATLCSLVPMYRGKEFTDLPATRFHCLPEVLRDAGYQTLFYSATGEPHFEGSDAFFARIGFSEVEFQEDLRGKDPTFWGVGLQDDVFYRRFFSVLDGELARSPGKPIFAVAANASNHYPFREGPAHEADPAEPTSYRRDYVGSLAESDAWLATFFDELEKRPALEDALVVLVSDHSFPADEHGIHFNMIGAYEEAFRAAFLLRWPGHVPAGAKIADRAASQVDVAPTIADLLGLRFRSHFAGRSLFSDAPPEPVAMVQPYDGVHLVAVKLPYKLVVQESAEQEHLYDLSKDPREEHDLLPEAERGPAERKAALAALRQAVARIRANQALLRENRVWPPDP
jgi:arylsulfatase A-like enzyme